MESQEKNIISENKMTENSLILIFRRASYFLSVNDSLKLLCLNHFFLHHLPNNEYYSYVSKSIASWIANLNENDPKLLDNFAKFVEWNPFNSYTDLYNTIRFSQNLIKNPCGELKLKYWKKIGGGDGWEIEEWNGYRHKKLIFASSFEWCSLTQVVNIPCSEQKRFCIVGAYVSRRSDCGALAELKVAIYDENGDTADEFKIEEFDITEPWPKLYLLKYKFEIQPNHRRVEVTYSGKDTLFWAGHYGARFNYCFARIFNSLIIS